MTAGYSGTPLTKKLGIKEGFMLRILDEPAHYWDLISPLPDRIVVMERAKKERADFIHLFVEKKNAFEKKFPKLKAELKKTGMLWVSWPKKTSKIQSDLDGNIVRNFGLANGLVDVKVCAVDETWSGLKFMYRIKDR